MSHTTYSTAGYDSDLAIKTDAKPKKTYEENLIEVMDDVVTGQHLRFIGFCYKTKEVCLAAVKHESSHTTMLNDIYSVPMGNLDYVMENMREIKKDDPYYLKGLEKAFIERKAEEQKLGYYDFVNYKAMLDHYKATDYDDMLRKRFDQMK